MSGGRPEVVGPDGMVAESKAQIPRVIEKLQPEQTVVLGRNGGTRSAAKPCPGRDTCFDPGGIAGLTSAISGLFVPERFAGRLHFGNLVFYPASDFGDNFLTVASLCRYGGSNHHGYGAGIL